MNAASIDVEPSRISTRTRIVLAVTGLRGDLDPFLAVAQGLDALGLRTLIATNSDLAPAVAAHGLEFVDIAPAHSTRWDRDFGRSHPGVQAYLRWRTFECFEHLMAKGGDDLLVVARSDNFMPVVCAERFGLPYGLIHTQPYAIPNPWGEVHHRDIIRYGHCRAYADLDPVDGLVGIPEGAAFILSMFPAWFGEPNVALWTAGRALGFPDPAPRHDHSAHAIEAFAPGQHPPILFIASSEAGGGPADFEMAGALGAALDMPVIYFGHRPAGVRPWEGVVSTEGADLELRELVGRAALVVHDGGIRVVGAAIRAGVPQLIRPGEGGEPDNAARVSALNLGRVVDPDDTDIDRIAGAARALLADQELRENLREASARARRDDASGDAAAIVASFLHARRDDRR